MPTFRKFLEDIASLKTERERAGFVRRALYGNAPWKTMYWGYYFLPHVVESLRGETPEFQLEMIESYLSPDHEVDVEPRGFGKSTWRKISVLKELCEAGVKDPRTGVKAWPSPTIGWIGPSSTDAKDAIGGIKPEIEDNERIRAVYGDLVPPQTQQSRKWTESHIELANGAILFGRGRLKGRGKNLRNRRPTKYVIDDIEDEESSENPEIRAKLKRWLVSVIVPSLARKDVRRGYAGGTIKMMGTMLLKDAVVAWMRKRYGGTFRAAIEDGESIWPEAFTVETLYEIRDGYEGADGEWVAGIGSIAFATEYLNNPMDEGATTLKIKWVDDGMTSEQPWDKGMPKGAEVTVHLDPKGGESKVSDEWTVTTLGRESGSAHRFVVEQLAKRSPSAIDQAKELIMAYRRAVTRGFTVRALTVETLLNQTAAFHTIMDWKARKIDFSTPDCPFDESDRNVPIAKFTPKGKSKLNRRQLFDAEFERGEIHLRPEMTEARDQLVQLGLKTLEHDDRADGIVACLETMGRAKPPPRRETARLPVRTHRPITAGLRNKKF